MAAHTLITKQELESGISKDEADRTSSIKKQNRDILGMGFCKKGGTLHMKGWKKVT